MGTSVYENCEIRLTSEDGKMIKISPNEIKIEGEFVNSYTTPIAKYYGIPKIYYRGKWRLDEASSTMENQFYPTKIIYNPPYTICYFGEEKVIVKCSEFDEFKPDFGVMACIMRRMFDTRAEFDRLVESGSWQESKEKKDK